MNYRANLKSAMSDDNESVGGAAASLEQDEPGECNFDEKDMEGSGKIRLEGALSGKRYPKFIRRVVFKKRWKK